MSALLYLQSSSCLRFAFLACRAPDQLPSAFVHLLHVAGLWRAQRLRFRNLSPVCCAGDFRVSASLMVELVEGQAPLAVLWIVAPQIFRICALSANDQVMGRTPLSRLPIAWKASKDRWRKLLRRRLVWQKHPPFEAKGGRARRSSNRRGTPSLLEAVQAMHCGCQKGTRYGSAT